MKRVLYRTHREINSSHLCFILKHWSPVLNSPTRRNILSTFILSEVVSILFISITSPLNLQNSSGKQVLPVQPLLLRKPGYSKPSLKCFLSVDDLPSGFHHVVVSWLFDVLCMLLLIMPSHPDFQVSQSSAISYYPDNRFFFNFHATYSDFSALFHICEISCRGKYNNNS